VHGAVEQGQGSEALTDLVHEAHTLTGNGVRAPSAEWQPA
jgi:hypothetical protein